MKLDEAMFQVKMGLFAMSRLSQELDGIFKKKNNMEQETKTITMPLSEYNEMKNDIAMLKTKNGVETLKELKSKINSLELDVIMYKSFYGNSEQRNKMLIEEIEKLQERKWWQIWKK